MEGGQAVLEVARAEREPVSRPAVPAWALGAARALFVLAQFYLVYKVAHRYNIESLPFRRLILLCVGAFAVNHFLPRRMRMAFFLLVSLAGFALVFGTDKGHWSLGAALPRVSWLVGLGVGLTLLCRLPGPFAVRAIAVAVAGLGLGLMRGSPASWPVPAAIWPILGSMFMFRAVVYLYHSRHEKQKATWTQALSYFFMTPNVCFPLFPVVDFKSFVRSHYDADAFRIYQTGLDWITRGILHLALYRLVYYRYYINPSQIENGADLVQFLVTNLLLYLRVSGQFHVIVGLLHMFGFNLTETHNKYWLASSFTDYWRRINIYWKDFIQKIVFYPLYFRFKKAGPVGAIVIATLIAFIVTWFTHDYQWFWLRGRWPTRWTDAAFWGALGLLVAGNVLWESKRGRKRTLKGRSAGWREHAVRALKTAGIFSVICVLWSLWSSASTAEWLELWRFADWSALPNIALVLGVVMLASLTPGIRPSNLANEALQAKGARSGASWGRSALLTCILPAIAMYALIRPEVQSLLGPRAKDIMASVTAENRPTVNDESFLQRGYYEDLMDVGLINSPLSEVFMRRPAGFKRLEETDAVRPTKDFRLEELVPSKTTVVNGKTITTNAAGMRDKEYATAKPAGVRRIGLIGASTVMGWMVNDNEVFEALVEDRLNAGAPGGAGSPRYELLNFGSNRLGPVSQVVVLDLKTPPYDLDAAVYVSQALEPYWAGNRLARAIRAGATIPGEELERIAKSVGVKRSTPAAVAESRLSKQWREIVKWSYVEFVARCRSRGVTPIWLYLPWYDGQNRDRDADTVRQLAKEAGFVVLDMGGMWDGVDMESVTVGAWDRHPNALGHQMIAERLLKELRGASELAPLGFDKAAAPAGGQ